jgi:hypothetical protein
VGIVMAREFPFPDDLKTQLNGQNLLTNLAGLEVYLSRPAALYCGPKRACGAAANRF